MALCRTFGPYLAGTAFAWSVTSGNAWPFNHHFMYLVVTVCSLIGAIESYFLPRSLNKPKEEQFISLISMDDSDDVEKRGGEVVGFNGNGKHDVDEIDLDASDSYSLESL